MSITIFVPTAALFVVFAVLFAAGIAASILYLLKPELVVELQKKCYAKMNWKVEPLSLEKELRNTRFIGISLGFFLAVVLAVALMGRLLLP